VRLAGHLIRAIAWMGGTLLSFTAMAISVRELTYDMHAFEMLFIRSAIGVAILTPIVWAAGWRTLRTKRLAGHLMRNAVHFTGQVLWRAHESGPLGRLGPRLRGYPGDPQAGHGGGRQRRPDHARLRVLLRRHQCDYQVADPQR
jgi:hypothetical protein